VALHGDPAPAVQASGSPLVSIADSPGRLDERPAGRIGPVQPIR
jgi:hypothetical protein